MWFLRALGGLGGAAFRGGVRLLASPLGQLGVHIFSALFFVAISADVAEGTIVPIISLLLGWAGGFLQFVLSPEFNSLPLTWGGIVDLGWNFTREAMNMFFIFWMVLMAFGTILGIEEYGLKKNFVTLILIAVVVNFTKVIAGVIVDMGQILVNFFVGSGLSGNGVMSIVQSLNLYQLFQTDPNFFSFLGEAVKLPVIDVTVQKMAKVTFEITFMGMATTMLLEIAMLLMFRVVAIWILVILAPVMFVLNASPIQAFKKLVGQWFGWLFGWSFTGVVMLFFMYLAAHLGAMLNYLTPIAAYREAFPEEVAAVDQQTAILFPGIQFIGKMTPFLIFITIYLFLHMGYTFAKSSQAMGMQFASGIAGKISGFAGGLAQKAAMGLGGIISRGITGQISKAWRDTASTPLGQRTAEVLTKVGKFFPIAGTGADAIMKASAEHKKNIEKAAEFSEKIPANLRKTYIETAVMHGDREALLGHILGAAKAGELDDSMRQYLSLAEQRGVAKDIYAVRPDWHADVNKLNDAIAIMNKGDMTKIQKEAINDPRVLRALISIPGQFEKFAQKGNLQAQMQVHVNLDPTRNPAYYNNFSVAERALIFANPKLDAAGREAKRRGIIP